MEVALAKALTIVCEQTELTEHISSDQFQSMLAENGINRAAARSVHHLLPMELASAKKFSQIVEKINFREGELKVDELLARLEVIRETAKDQSGSSLALNHQSEMPGNSGVLLANSFASGESALDPWKRTVSQISMGSIREPESNSCRVEVVPGETEGPFYDRHRTYYVSLSSDVTAKVIRRYKDFQWLRNTLVTKYPFRIVPRLPEKRIGSVMAASDHFLASRRRGLEEFLFLIVNHPNLQKDVLLIEFFSSDDFSQVRARESIDLMEEYSKVNIPAAPSNTNGQSLTEVGPTLPQNEWLIYDDAKKWAKLIRESFEGLRKSTNSLTLATLDTQNQLAIMANNMHQILDNTQHAGGSTFSAVPKALESLVEPHSDLIEHLSRHGLRLEVYLRLVDGCLEMIDRTRRSKFDDFGSLANQIVSAQANAEKLRARDGTTSTPELEKALSLVTELQWDLMYNCKRNDFADECLRQELGWLITMTRGIPLLFHAIQASLNQHFHTISDLSLPGSTTAAGTTE